jgi:manganese/zinc/iron transport system substrate-binding protein
MEFFKKFFLRSVLVVLLALALIGCFAGCSNQKGRGAKLNDWMRESGQVKILCTTAQIGDLVSEIGGDRVKTWVLIQGDLDPHSYELVKGDDEKILSASLVFYNGLNLEHGASLSALLRSSPRAVAVGDAIAMQFPEKILKRGSTVDPHLWMDISVWQLTVPTILDQLCSSDPEGASYYRKRADLLLEKMEIVHQEIQAKLHRIPPHKRYLLTSHDAFRYFTRSYLAPPGEENWERRFAAPEGLSPDGQLSPVDIQRMIDFLRVYQISVLFPESNVSRDSIKKIASAGQELGLQIRVCNEPLYGDSMSGLSYLEMMQKNGDVVARYLYE